jgi:hypothetical protein
MAGDERSFGGSRLRNKIERGESDGPEAMAKQFFARFNRANWEKVQKIDLR